MPGFGHRVGLLETLQLLLDVADKHSFCIQQFSFYIRYLHSDIISWDKIELDQPHPKILVADGDEPSRDLTDADKRVLEKVKEFALDEAKVSCSAYVVAAVFSK